MTEEFVTKDGLTIRVTPQTEYDDGQMIHNFEITFSLTDGFRIEDAVCDAASGKSSIDLRLGAVIDLPLDRF